MKTASDNDNPEMVTDIGSPYLGLPVEEANRRIWSEIQTGAARNATAKFDERWEMKRPDFKVSNNEADFRPTAAENIAAKAFFNGEEDQ